MSKSCLLGYIFTDDDSGLTLDRISRPRSAIYFIDAAIKQGGKVLVHCHSQ